jgi:hypothetical protein
MDPQNGKRPAPKGAGLDRVSKFSQNDTCTALPKTPSEIQRRVGPRIPGLRTRIRAPLSERDPVELYETPAVATEALLLAESIPHRVWECASGPGSIVRVLRAAGHHVTATDLIDYGSPDQDAGGRDFLLETELPAGVSMIISNPPYRQAEKFISHALTLCPRVAMLLRLVFYEGRRSSGILDDGRLARVRVFSNRLPMLHRANWSGNKVSNPTAFAWFVWDRDHRGPTVFDRITWKPLTANVAPADSKRVTPTHPRTGN